MENHDHNSVILPREVFEEMQEGFQTPPTATERLANTTQATVVFAAAAFAFAGATWGWARAMDWLEERNFQRRMREFNASKTAVHS